MIIIITENCGYGIVKGVFQGKEMEFTFDYIQKNGVETEVLYPNGTEYWYLKTKHVEKNDEDDVISVDIEDEIFTDCTFYQTIDKTTNEVLNCNVSHEDIEVIKENLDKENKYLNEISKEQFLEYWRARTVTE